MRRIDFETRRLQVGEWLPDADAEAAFAIYGDPEVVKYLGRVPCAEPTREAAREKIATRVASLAEKIPPTRFSAVIEKASGEVIGTMLCQNCPDGERQPTGDWEIGWHLRRNRWGQGFASEAASALVSNVFSSSPGISRLIAIAYPENVASLRVMEKIGMQKVGLTSLYYGIETMCYEVLRVG